ncbi:uncharacterized protein LODBEIA_P44410 [Lodderomyces beijingensis]|uniref:Nonsense-mediated decay protein 4 n=1 Tax=Lodderomyces beijingensis TaxID=1775926 RepID=A0ABP0ZV31_9ASCO
MSDGYDFGDTEEFFEDELVGPMREQSSLREPHQLSDELSMRQVRLILDQTAFVRGIGNVKRWFNDEYIEQNWNASSDKIKLNIYIPSYTLHEFDFVKRGTSISATNAREAIKFIDNYLENFAPGQPQAPDCDRIQYNLNLESPQDATPSWNSCTRFKVFTPKIKDFPNYKTSFDSNQVRQVGDPSNLGSSQQGHNHNYCNESSQDVYQDSAADFDSNAEMPARLRYLIRTCIYKRFVEKYQPPPKNSIEEWKLVTEDPITKIWAKAYGIDCVNVNEAELLIFQNYDVNSFRVYNPFSSDENSFDPRSDILQNRIDTTSYSYYSVKQAPPRVGYRNKNNNSTNRSARARNRMNKSKKPPRIPIEGVVHEETTESGTTKKEKFKAINYAPRGEGQLWKP